MTSPSGLDLIGFVRARLDEDERIAVAAGGDSWRAADPGLYHENASRSPGAFAVGPYGDLGDEAQHIARHDPARVLAEVNAKRAMLDEHAPVVDGAQSGWKWHAGSESVSGQIVRLLALPYANHHDYREEWRP